MRGMIRSVGLLVGVMGAGLAGIGAGSNADAQVGFSYSNWGGRSGVSVAVGNPYAWGYPVYAAPVVTPVPVVASPVVVAPRYAGWYGYRGVPSPYWGNRWGYGPRYRYGRPWGPRGW